MSKQASMQVRLADVCAKIVCAYITNNRVPSSSLPTLIGSVQFSLINLKNRQQVEVAPVFTVTEAQICESITPDAIISFIDGKGYKTLKRHLTRHGLDALSYREKFGLPHDYPIVASSYSERRSAISRGHQFGKRNGA